MILTDTAVKGFVVGLVCGIVAATFVPLGIVFAILGFTTDEPFLPIGLPFLAAGVVLVFVALGFRRRGRRRAAAEAEARTSYGVAEIIEAVPNPYSRVGARYPMRLDVALAGGRYKRTLYVPFTCSWRPGDRLQVAYQPDDPRNFVPV
jgi:hypothetical protein